LPNIFDGNQARLREGANLERLTAFEWIERHNRFFDRKQLAWLGGTAMAITALGYAARYGQNPGSVFHGLYNATTLPEFPTRILNVINEDVLFWLKGQGYGNAVLGIALTFAKGAGIIRGIIPWRGDQIKWINKYLAERKNKIAEGIQPVQYVGHIVGYGMRDPLVSAEMEDGLSFTRHLKNEFENVVLIQRGENYWRPKNLGLEFNDDQLYVNLPRLQRNAPSIPELLSHIIISGAYQAGGILINGQREFELFDKRVVDIFDDEDKLNYALAADLVRHAQTLRDIVFEEAPPLRVSIVTPKYLAPKVGFDKGGESWMYTVQIHVDH